MISADSRSSSRCRVSVSFRMTSLFQEHLLAHEIAFLLTKHTTDGAVRTTLDVITKVLQRGIDSAEFTCAQLVLCQVNQWFSCTSVINADNSLAPRGSDGCNRETSAAVDVDRSPCCLSKRIDQKRAVPHAEALSLVCCGNRDALLRIDRLHCPDGSAAINRLHSRHSSTGAVADIRS